MATTAALVFAGKSVATPAISFIVNKAFSYLSEWHQAEGMKVVKDRLLQMLNQIQAVYDAVDHQQINEQSHALDKWLWQFRDAVEGAEDVLDEIDYYKLEEEAGVHNLELEVCNSVAKNFKQNFVRKVAKYTSEGNMVKNLRMALTRFDETAAGVGTFLHLTSRFGSALLPDHAEKINQETSSTLVATEIFGRDTEKNEVMRWLVDNIEGDSNTPGINRVPVSAIIGMGGIGKTTLAQIVCEELRDLTYFDCIVWVHVSDNSFNAARITKNILEALTKQKPNADTLEALQHILKENLESKKILLILDDVWEDSNWGEWQKLMAPFQNSPHNGSRILLTTRMTSVADMVTSVMQSNNNYMNLNGLDEYHNFMMFKKYAFYGMKTEDYEHLLPLAEKIAKKFQGCPLVTKIASEHLRSNVSHHHWNNLYRQLENLEGKMSAIITTVLQSSYHHLPEHLQLCFRYCSIFPKGYEFKKDEIVKMWMGSGLILIDSGTERPEDIGERYLVQLARKSFFTFATVGDPCSKFYAEYYVMHDLLHKLACSVSVGECLRLESSGYMQHKCTVRHLWIANFNKLTTEEIKAISSFENLRSLIIEDSYHVNDVCIAALEEVVQLLRGLRLLSLKGITKFCLAKEVVNKHLRYISFSGMQDIDGISKLYHLQVLTAVKRISTALKQVNNIENLSHLRYVSYGSNGFGEFFVGRLTSLQELHNFEIQLKEGYRISSLRNLSSICKLQICNLENVGTHEEIIEAKLRDKSYLRSLSLNWSETTNVLKNDDDLILDKLESHSHLENLEISGYNGL